ncbi:MAG: TOBE domain-containing protein, partial [Rubrivivax sp.]|nr:TOBE domain-containing protein [Rubrivivax sp.]
IYVTHDQTEALVLSDRIAIMNGGAIQQIDVAENIYRNPRSRFVADFMGLTNFIEGVASGRNESRGWLAIRTSDGLVFWGKGEGVDPGDPLLFCVRPETMELFGPGQRTGDHVFEGIIENAANLGEFMDYRVKIGQWSLRTKVVSRTSVFRKGEKVGVWLDPDGCFVIKEAR